VSLYYSKEGIKYGNHITNIYPVAESLINISRIEYGFGENKSFENSFEFVGIDSETRGNWQNKYGKMGYDIFYGRPNLPDQILILYKFYGDYIYHEVFKADQKNQSAIMLPDNSARIIPLMDNEFALYVDVALTNCEPVKISFYFLNYTGTAKRQEIKIIDLNSKKEVYFLTIEDYFGGVYYSFRAKGLYRFCLENGAKNIGTKTTSPINGIFFD